MKHIYCTLLACLISISSFCQENASIQKLITDFEQSILTKDSVRFKKLFLDAQVSFVGIMSAADWSLTREVVFNFNLYL